MAKIEIGTNDATIHTKAIQLNIPHIHERRHCCRNSYAWFDFEVDDKVAIALGFEISAYDPDVVIVGNDPNNSKDAELLAEANFEPVAFLEKKKATNEAEAVEAEQYKLKRQREEEEAQRHKFAREKARELLSDQFAVMVKEIEELKRGIAKGDERISELEDYLHKLIMSASEPALQRAGLVEPQDESEEEEEPTPEQQEALQTVALDC